MIEPMLGSIYAFKWNFEDRQVCLTGVAVKLRSSHVVMRTKKNDFDVPLEDLVEGPLPRMKELP